MKNNAEFKGGEGDAQVISWKFPAEKDQIKDYASVEIFLWNRTTCTTKFYVMYELHAKCCVDHIWENFVNSV